jgi:hypothetical protein
MDKVPTFRYFFRKPKFPVFVSIEGNLICGKSAITLARRLSKIENLHNNTYKAIDSSGEGWSFHPQQWLISPLTLKKRWTKLELIRLFNERGNKKSEDPLYSEKSLSAKRLERIINDIFELLNKT